MQATTPTTIWLFPYESYKSKSHAELTVLNPVQISPYTPNEISMVVVHLYIPPSFAHFIPDFSDDLPLSVPGPYVVRAHPPELHSHMIGTDSEQPKPGTSSEFCEDREHRQSPHTTNYANFSQTILLHLPYFIYTCIALQ